MNVTPARRLSEGPRRAALLGAGVGLAVLILVAKWALIGPFVSQKVMWSVALVVFFLVAMSVGARVARLERLDGFLTALPALLVLVVAFANTPMVFEAESFARGLPHPEGGGPVTVDALSRFDAGHPIVSAEWVYADARDATTLTEDARAAFEREGWHVATATPPGVQEFGFVVAEKWGFRAACNLWDAPSSRMHCTLTV